MPWLCNYRTPWKKWNHWACQPLLLVAMHGRLHHCLVAGCNKYQRYRKDTQPKILVHPQEVPEGTWQVIGVDLISPLPLSQGKEMILHVVDHYTKQIHLFPVTSQITVDGVASIYFEQIFPLHGIPKIIISDRGLQFAARSMHALYKWLGINAGLSVVM